MRLLNAETLEVEDGFFEKNTPRYAILSHVWGNEEVVLQDLDDRIAATQKAGYRKIEKTCRLALKEGFHYVWIDTCCIDKLSSAELSEAINSMFRWYQNAGICYVYLSDVDSGLTDDNFASQFRTSKWFTRGWTLQELIAPHQLTFLTSNWDYLSDRAGLSHSISDITGINQKFLRNRRQGDVSIGGLPSQPSVAGIQSLLAQASIAERMSWASARQTTRVEDLAYSLLGIFGVNMPLLYGEGENAFLRLQHTIAGQSSDQTLFAWSRRTSLPAHTTSGIFATSPSAFENSANLVPFDNQDDIAPFSVTNRGLHITIPMKDGSALLQCRHRDDIGTISTIVLRKVRGKVYARAETDLLGTVSYQAWRWWSKETVYLATSAADIQEGAEGGFVIRNLPQGFNTSGAHVGRVIPFRNQLSWKLGGGERFEDAIILKQGEFEASLTLWAWRTSRSFNSRTIRKTLAGYQFTTRPRPTTTSINNTGPVEHFSALAHPKGTVVHAAITQEKVLGQNIFFVDVVLTTNPVTVAWIRLTTAVDLVYHRAVVWAANATPAAFSISLVEVAERMTAFADSLSFTLLTFWMPWIIHSVIYAILPVLSSLVNPDHKVYVRHLLSFEQMRVYVTLLYEITVLVLIVGYDYSGAGYKPSYLRSADVEESNTLWLTEYIFPHEGWVHMGIVFFISFILQAVMPSALLRSLLLILVGAMVSMVGLMLAFLSSRSVMESFIWHAILARDQSDEIETSKPEASAKDTDAENRGVGKGSG
ncbi:heterokaryon incompatibility protein-domain-containing protein [Bombardia bombarda]|uniref:Heterokaryon incompatibility protein-domain-containing protein n=1 Tax=Bombardia bombarda TaxID=252184 RepID=A0AA39XMU5_9PEZI|nr:heterokaryon incompatibility protein-domain-containing protein [Bombardia bombarda]